MTCAGCDDCPQDAWHLHVTVKPHWSWSLDDVASALRRDIERHGIRPIVVTNHFRDGRSYKELIPTKHHRGTESDASREIFRMGVLLNNSGWRVKRLKIEGNPAAVAPGRAIYFEAHLKEPIHECMDTWPTSTNAKGERIVTVRRKSMQEMQTTYAWLYVNKSMRIEACVLDTAPELDHDWMNQ